MATNIKSSLPEVYQALIRDIQAMPQNEFGEVVKTLVSLSIASALEDGFFKMDTDPLQILDSMGKCWRSPVQNLAAVSKMHASESAKNKTNISDVIATKKLFENAWTTYSESTYEHSVKLIRERLEANGWGPDYFAGKTCFDGGCGTGRFALAMAELGAKRVIAADIGGASLSFFREIIRTKGQQNVELVEMDVTDLHRFTDGYFDVVVSNGVLHHASETLEGIREHFRVTKPGGDFWLYLYGEGGIYWDAYDSLKTCFTGADPSKVRFELLKLGVREGMVYTFLDNVMAPIRKYYLWSEVKKMLEEIGAFTWKNAKGRSHIDDTARLLENAFGKDYMGPEGEVRVIMRKA